MNRLQTLEAERDKIEKVLKRYVDRRNETSKGELRRMRRSASNYSTIINKLLKRLRNINININQMRQQLLWPRPPAT